VVSIFVGALHNPQPHDVPVGVVAPPPVLHGLEAGLARKSPGAFSLHVYPSAAEAQKAVSDHAVDGSLVVTGRSAQLFIASAAGAVMTATISEVFEGMARATRLPVTVRDLKPLPAADPRGSIPYYLTFGLMIAGILFSLALFLLARDAPLWSRIGVLLLFAALAGPIALGIADLILGAQTRSFWQVAALASLLSLAVASATGAAQRLAGLAGTGLAAVIIFLLGNSTSGGMVNYQFLSDGFRQLSQYLPPGAAVTAIRNAAYFDGSSLSDHGVLTLIVWAVVGLALIIAEGLLGRVQRPEGGQRITTERLSKPRSV
jgi:hypothetical protein